MSSLRIRNFPNEMRFISLCFTYLLTYFMNAALARFYF